FAALGITWLARRGTRRWPAPLRVGVGAAAAVGVAAACGWRAWDLCERNQKVEDRLRKPLGLWLRAESRPGDRVMLEPIGYIGYYSRLPVLDVVGLVSPQVLPYWNSRVASPLAEIAGAFRPEW